MTNPRFPFLRLPDDLRLKVLQTTDTLEMIAYSCITKKAYSMVQSLHLPISNVKIIMKKQPEIDVLLGSLTIKFLLNMHENDEKMMDLNGLPVNVKVTYRNYKNGGFQDLLSTWTNREKSVGEWIQHLCSLNQPKYCYHKTFHVREVELDIQTLSNTFPKLGNIELIFSHAESNEHDIMSAKNILKAFLPHDKLIKVKNVHFQDNFSLQHIGMANLKWLHMQYPRNLNVHDLSTLNSETIWIETDQMSLRNLNRFIKLWKKGSNRKLQELTIFWKTDIRPVCKVLFKGLNAKTKRDRRRKKFRIVKNCRGVRGELRCEWWPDSNRLHVEFAVPK